MAPLTDLKTRIAALELALDQAPEEQLPRLLAALRELRAQAGEYIVNVPGKYYGRRVRDLPRRDLEKYVKWWEEQSGSRGWPRPPDLDPLKVAVAEHFHDEIEFERKDAEQ